MKRPRAKKNREYVVGNILDVHAKYIVHQVNAVTSFASGLAATIFASYPSANNYTPRNQNVPGSIVIVNRIVNLCGQRYPGLPTVDGDDTAAQRLKWFKLCLEKLAKSIPEDATVAVPVNIGCGLTGGTWSLYLQAISEWHDRHPSIFLTLVHFMLNTWMVHFSYPSCTKTLILHSG